MSGGWAPEDAEYGARLEEEGGGGRLLLLAVIDGFPLYGLSPDDLAELFLPGEAG